MKPFRSNLERETQKRARAIAEGFLLTLIAALILLSILIPRQPQQPPAYPLTGERLVALRYPAISPDGGNGTFSVARLREQLESLRESGYVTPAQKDLLAFREGKQLLPQKALSLTFEGDPVSLLLAEPILRKCGYQAAVTQPASLNQAGHSVWERAFQSGYWEQSNPALSFAEGNGVNEGKDAPWTWRIPDEMCSGLGLAFQLSEDSFQSKSLEDGWNAMAGGVSGDGNALLLTPLNGSLAMARLEAAGIVRDLRLEIRFPQASGVTASVYLRASPQLTDYVRLSYTSGVLTASQCKQGLETSLFQCEVSPESLEVWLAGDFLTVGLDADTILAETPVEVTEGGVLYLQADGAGSEVPMGLTVWKSAQTGETRIYSSSRPARTIWKQARETWERVWARLRISL